MPRALRRSGFNTDSHRIGHGLPQDCANPCCVCDNLCFYAQWRRGIQPERLNAEGDSPSARSRGLSEAQPPESRHPQRKASEGRESSRQGSRYSRFPNASWWVTRYRGLRFAPPPATSHSLRSGVRPFRSCCGYRGQCGRFC